MSTSTPKRLPETKSSSYPGSPRNDKLKVNLTEAFSENSQELQQQDTVYQTALELSSSSTDEQKVDITPVVSINTNKPPVQVDGIHEMEMLRDQIRNMLDPTVNNYSGGYSPDALNLSSTSSIDTIALLRSALPHLSPELQLDENGVLLASSNASNYSRYSSTRQTSPALDSSLVAENTILKENIEKERFRRKHCEDQIHELQNKLLECQEQLAVAKSVEKKKEIMISQLDKTLANVVEGWKKQDHAKKALIDKLKEEKQDLELMQQTHDAVCRKFESELSEAVEALKHEQHKQNTAEQNYQIKLKEFEDNVSKLQKENNDLQNAIITLEEEKNELLKLKEQIINEKENAAQNFSQDYSVLKSQHDQLSEELTLIKSESNKALTQLQNLLEDAHRELETNHEALQSNEKAIEMLKTDLASTKKQKETILLENSLLKSKFDALKTKQDSEMRAQLEEEFNKQIYEIQKQIAKTETELRNAQKKQLSELHKQHYDEMEEQKQRFQHDIQQINEKYKQKRLEYEERLRASNNEIMALSGSRDVLLSQKTELMNRVKSLMQQHWDETVSLLSNDKPTPVSLQDTHNQLSSTMISDTQSVNYSMDTNEKYHNNNNKNSINQHFKPDENFLSQRHTSLDHKASFESLNHRDLVSTSSNPPMVHHPTYLYSQGANSHLLIPQKEANSHILIPQKEANSHILIPQIQKTADVQQQQRYQNSATPPRYDQQSIATPPRYPQPQGKDTSQDVDVKNQVPNASLLQSAGLMKQNRYDNSMKSGLDYPTKQSLDYSTHQQQPVLPVPYYPYQEEIKQYQPRDSDHQHQQQQLLTKEIPSRELTKEHLTSSISSHTAASQKDDPISLLYQDLDDVNDNDVTNHESGVVDQRMNEQEEKQERLTHFIEKLLQRSPGQPTTDMNDTGGNETISDRVERILNVTPSQKPQINTTAFKKSVIRDQQKTLQHRHRKSDDLLSDEKKMSGLNEKQIAELELILMNNSKADGVKLMKALQKIISGTENEATEHRFETTRPSNERLSPADKLQKVYTTHVRKATISSEAKQHSSNRKSTKSRSNNLNKNVATKEERKRKETKPSNTKNNNAWK